jgi:UDP-GlcNAc:undecaprenyl-phosphate/decaprenyl-phosphate GlcNAc-1-phosphate transferase
MVRASQIAIPAACSGVLSAALCYSLARWSDRLRLVAKPRPDRWHQRPTPNTGGLGILIACAAAYVLFAGTRYATVAACAGAISLLGFVDDRVQLLPLAKLAGQAAATAVVVFAGIILHCTPWYWADITITAVWIIGITNAFNLIDNMDGLCGGVAAIAAASGAVLASLQQDAQRALLLIILCAACLGFLMFNHKPARIFMGDCGSMFLGFSLASLAVVPPHRGNSILESFYTLPAFLYPIFDTTLVSVLRRAAGRPVSVGGRDHSSHRLVSTGLTERTAVWILWSITAMCACYGPMAYHHPRWFIFLTALLLTALAVFGIFLAGLPGFAISRAAPVGRPHPSFPRERSSFQSIAEHRITE